MSIPAKPPPQTTSRPSKRRKLDVDDAATQTSPSLLERNTVFNPGNKITNFGYSSWRVAALEKQADLNSRVPGEQGNLPNSNAQNATEASTRDRGTPVAPSSFRKSEAIVARQAQNGGSKPRNRTPPSHSKDLLEALNTRSFPLADDDPSSPSTAAQMRLRKAQGARIPQPAKHPLQDRTSVEQQMATSGVSPFPSVQQQPSESTTDMNPTQKTGALKRVRKQELAIAGPSGYNNRTRNPEDANLNVRKRARKDSPVIVLTSESSRTRISDVDKSATRNGSHEKVQGIADPPAYKVPSRGSGTVNAITPNYTGKLRHALAGPSCSCSNRSSDLTNSIPSKSMQMQPLVVKSSGVKSIITSSRAASTTSAELICHGTRAEPRTITRQPLSRQAAGKAANLGANLLSSSQPSSTPLSSSGHRSSSRRSGPYLKWTREEEQILIECHNRQMCYAEMQRYLPGRSSKSLQHKVAKLKMESKIPNGQLELSSGSRSIFRLGDSISATVSTQRQMQLPFLPDKGKGRADGKPRVDERASSGGRKSAEQFSRTPKHPDVVITVNARLSQKFLAKSIRGATIRDEEDPIEDGDGHIDANANEDLMETEDEIPMEDMIAAEKEMSSSRAHEAAKDPSEVDRITVGQLGSTIDNALSVSSDSDSSDTHDIPSSPPEENWISADEEVVPADMNSKQQKVNRQGILIGNQEMEYVQPWDSAVEELGYSDHHSDDIRPSNHPTSRSPIVKRMEEIKADDIASLSKLEDGSDSDDSNASSELTSDASSEVSSSSIVSNDTPSAASGDSSQSARAIPESLDTYKQTQSTTPARNSQKEAEPHKSPINPFLNAWPNMSKRPPNWHSGMTDSEGSSSSDSDSEDEPAKETSKPLSKQDLKLAARNFKPNRDKGGMITGGVWVADNKSHNEVGGKQSEVTTRTKEKEATSKQRKDEIANHINETQSTNKQRDKGVIGGTNEKQPTKKNSEEKAAQNKGKQPATDQHVHNVVPGNYVTPTFKGQHDKAVATPIAAKEKSNRHVERGIQTTPRVDSIVRSGFYKSTESSKSQARRARRQRSRNRLATT